jgi:TatD DNase family protein
MQWIDTHAHLYATEFDEDRAEVLARAKAAGVYRVYLPAIDSSCHAAMLQLEAEHPEQCIAMMGLHPCYVKENVAEELAIVEQYLKSRPFVAIGEIGLDLYWDKTFFEQQKMAFRQQIRWAIDLDIPIVIHTREAMAETIALVREEKTDKLRGIFHCFSGTLSDAQEIIELGFLLGIGGVVTYKKSGMDAIVQDIDIQHLVLETDAPYLTPTPFRGKRNESSYIPYIAQRIAEVKGISLDELAQRTSENALKLFEK